MLKILKSHKIIHLSSKDQTKYRKTIGNVSTTFDIWKSPVFLLHYYRHLDYFTGFIPVFPK